MKNIFTIMLLMISSIKSFGQVTELWTAKAPMPTARSGMGAAVLDSIIYVIGGSYGLSGDTLYNTVEAYNTSTDSWTTKSPMPTTRNGFGIAVVGGVIYAIGGWGGSSSLTTVEAYDPSTDTWTTKSPMPTQRSELFVGAVGNNIYAIGGYYKASAIANVEEYNTTTDTWVEKSAFPFVVEQDNSCIVINGKLHALGGKNDYSTVYYATNYEYDTTTDTWTADTSMPFPRYEGAVTIFNNEIYYLGGFDSTVPSSTVSTGANNNNICYDTSTHSWASKLQIPVKTGSHTAVTVNNKIYVIGGRDSSLTDRNWNYEYSLDTAIDTETNVNAVNPYLLKVYPNPAIGIYTIEVQVPGAKTIEIADVSGKLIWSLKTPTQVINVDISDFADGLYIMTVYMNGKKYMDKLIKQ